MNESFLHIPLCILKEVTLISFLFSVFVIDTGICQVKQCIEFVISSSIKLLALIQSFKISGITTYKFNAVTFVLDSSKWSFSCKNTCMLLSYNLMVLLTLGFSQFKDQSNLQYIVCLLIIMLVQEPDKLLQDFGRLYVLEM